MGQIKNYCFCSLQKSMFWAHKIMSETQIFLETKFYYNYHVLELNFLIKNMSRKCPQKPKKIIYVEKVPKIIFIKKKITQKLINLKHLTLKKYLKETESVQKVAIFIIEKIMKIKKGSNKKIVFSRPLENYVLGK